MRNLFIITICVCVLAAAATAGANDPFKRFDCKVDGQINLIVAEDMNGDNFDDMIVSYRRGFEPNVTMRLAIFIHRTNGYSPTPDYDLVMPADACLFDIAEIDGDGRNEIVLFRKWKVQAIILQNGGKTVSEDILRQGSGVMFPPFSGELPYEDLVRDWTGDGSIALALPDFGKLRFFRPNEQGELAAAESLDMPVRGWIRSRGTLPAGMFDFNISTGLSTPSIFLGPQRQNGRDLIFANREDLRFHAGTAAGFTPTARRFFFPIRTEEERRRDNVNLITIVDDLDGDKRPDVVLNKFGGSLTNFKSTIQIYSGLEGGFSTTPGYKADFSGYTAMLQFWDVDGDGRKEMAMPTADIGLVQIARMLMSQKVKVVFKMFRCRGNIGQSMYAANADFSRQVTYTVDTEAGIALVGFTPSFAEDFNNDGRPDLFMAHGEGFGVWKNQGNLQFADQPQIAAKLQATMSYHLQDLNKDGKSDLFIWDTLNPDRQNLLQILVNVN